MQKSVAFAGIFGLVALAGTAHAEGDEAVALGPAAAHLAVAQAEADENFRNGDYVLRHDPSGAPMCFDSSGAKTALSNCEDEREASSPGIDHILAFDPSGAPMCFNLAGIKAPLAACASESTESQGLVSVFQVARASPATVR